MSRANPTATKDMVIQLYKKRPDLSSPDMAEELGCHPAYIRATLSRAGLRLASNVRNRKPFSRCGFFAGEDLPENIQSLPKPKKKQIKRLTKRK